MINMEYIIEMKQKGKNCIFAFWHSQLFIMPYIYRFKFKKKSISVLISLSRDGEYISRTVEKFGFQPVRGSTSRGAESAIHLLIRQIQKGQDAAITPDGPRGPRYQVQPGIIRLAELTGRPIIPVGYKTARKTILKTWDRFIIPHPFSLTKFIAGRPILVPKGISDQGREQIRRDIQNTLLKISEL